MKHFGLIIPEGDSVDNLSIGDDLTPQLGANLDVNGFDIVGINGATGGYVAIVAGNTTANAGYGGNVTITAGTGDGVVTDAYGGNIAITAGAGVGVNYYAGSVDITGGASDYTGGDVIITSGAGTGGTGGYAGSMTIAGGDGVSGAGGQVTIRGGGSDSESASDTLIVGGTAGTGLDAGHAVIKGGLADSGTAGNVQLQPGNATAGSPNLQGVIEIYGPGSSATELAAVVRFYENGGLLPTSNNFVALKAPDFADGTLTADRTWVLPADNPSTADGNYLTTDASGVMSFAPVVTMMDTPILLVVGSTPPETATAETHANLTGKSKAILRCRALIAVSGAAALNTQGEIIGHIGPSSTLTSVHRVVYANAIMQNEAVTQNVWTYDTNDVTVNLDGSSQFWHKVVKTVPANVTVWFEIHLIGWHD